MKSTALIPSEFPIWLEFPVIWGDLNAHQHLNHSTYIKWFETAQQEYFRRLQTSDEEHKNQGLMVASMESNFVYPVTFPDQVKVGIKVKEFDDQRIKMISKFYSTKFNTLVAFFSSSIIHYDFNLGETVTVPQLMWDNIIRLEKSVPSEN
ncbi:acyl-CoA thioesterase [Sediminitomix flava]|uniref:Acyl-CoA thioester hydrolase n=1 Tax=Sediminitomix flava TaxID=379075 RepID=A0A315ZGY7_SEDFL|nr:thioesterase family protein [Sediminitomix flava]PWJ44433.1 acyl-CoA thioester hydrolase [Sediminitomix flava]